jgi:hypothetical protein
VLKKSENGFSVPNISRISSSLIVRKPPGPPPAHVHRPAAVIEAGAAGRAPLLVHPPVGAQLVVLLPLLRIAEHLVGLVDFLELRLGRLVAGVDVGVVLARQLPVRALDLLVGGGLGDPERLVVVLEVHRVRAPGSG